MTDGNIISYVSSIHLHTVAISFFAAFFPLLALTLLSGKSSLRVWRVFIGKRQSHWTHSKPVMRIGGLIIFLSTIFAHVLSDFKLSMLLLLMGTTIPLLIVGLLEDLGREVTPKTRLLCGTFSGLLAVFFFSAWLTSVRVPFFDSVLSLAPIAILITVLASTMLAQCFNLVDGLNGLSSGMALIALTGGGWIAWEAGEVQLASMMIILGGSVLAFWLINSLFARVFLGDLGAYTLGHVVAWFAIILTSQNQVVSPWAMLLLVIYPLSELLMTIIRRIAFGVSLVKADRLHLHHIVHQYILRMLPNHPTVSNTLSAILLITFAAIPAILAVLNSHDTIFCSTVAGGSLVVFFSAYCFLYFKMKSSLSGV